MSCKTAPKNKASKMNNAFSDMKHSSVIRLKNNSISEVRASIGFTLRSDDSVRKSQVKGYKYILP